MRLYTRIELLVLRTWYLSVNSYPLLDFYCSLSESKEPILDIVVQAVGGTKLDYLGMRSRNRAHMDIVIFPRTTIHG